VNRRARQLNKPLQAPVRQQASRIKK